MKPQELFDADPAEPWWVHGEHIGVDEKGGLWVREDAELKPELPLSPVTMLSKSPAAMGARHFTILTSARKTALNPRDRTEPVWQHVTELEAGSTGSGWLAVS